MGRLEGLLEASYGLGKVTSDYYIDLETGVVILLDLSLSTTAVGPDWRTRTCT